MNLFSSPETVINEAIKPAIRDGTAIDKGMVLTEQYLIQHEAELQKLMDTFIAYPDVYLDLIQPVEMHTELYFYQRIVLRSIMRFKRVYVVACRAFSKTFITILGLMLQCGFIPNTHRFICAPNKNQAAQIAKEKIYEIYRRWPLLAKEVRGCELTDTPGNFGEYLCQ